MRLAHYEIQERIGKGGMGVVYKARDTHLGRTVAVKVLPPLVSNDPERRSRFLREAQAAANLNHPNIATIYQFGTAEVADAQFSTPMDGGAAAREVLFLAMEYVEGEDLQAKVGSSDLDVRKVIGWGIQIAEGLEVAHEAGVIHRDLKPNNVRITHDGRVKLLDFGLAKVREEGLSHPQEGVADIGFQTSQGMLLGTPPYMAPEMLKGTAIDHRSDLFSLGVVLFQLLAGEPPYPADNLLEYVKALSKKRPRSLRELRPEVTPDQEAVIQKLLAHEPEDRYASAHEIARDLRAVGGSAPTTPATQLRLPRPRGRGPLAKRVLSSVVGLIGLLAAIVLTVRFVGPPDSSALTTNRALTITLFPFQNHTDDIHLAGEADEQRLFLISELAQSEGVQLLLPSQGSSGELSPESTGIKANGSLEGALLRVDNHLRLAISLKEEPSKLLIWTHPYEGSLREIQQKRQVIASHIRVVLETWRFVGGQRRLEAADFSSFAQALPETADAHDPSQFTEIFDLAIELDRTFSPAYSGRSLTLQNLAVAQQDKEMLRRARADALRAVELDQEDTQARMALGRLHRIQGEYLEAVDQFQHALEIEPSSHENLFELSVALLQSGQRQAAAEALEQALAIAPGDWEYLNQLGVVRRESGDAEAAATAFQNAVDRAPKHLKVWPAGNLMALAIDDEEPGRVFEIAENLPKPLMDAWTASNLGTAYFEVENMAQAEKAYRRALELEPTNAPFQRNLGDVLLRQEKTEEARAAFQDAVTLLQRQMDFNPTVEKQGWLALYLAKAGQCKKSREIEDAMAAPQPTAPNLLLDLAQARALCQDRAAAIQLLEELAQRSIDLSDLRDLDELASLRDSPDFLRLTQPL